jgi:probable F420-dependent oxidoreductase
MQFGAVFPQTEIGNDPGAIRDWAQAVEGLGYRYILVYDHVLGAGTANRPDWCGYTSDDPFHEVFVLYGYLAAVTERVGLALGVLVLPQRQTALVAKQAAAIDVLSGGRLRLGIGVGWNHVEFEALGEDFHNRGARCDEQIEVLNRLWSEPIVDFKGRWHTIPEAGINPLPVQRPIPLWFGGHSEAMLRRTARYGAGWMPLRDPDDAMRATIERLRAYTAEAGRPADALGIEPHLDAAETPPDAWPAHVEAWRQLGATHLCASTMGGGYTSPQQHIDTLRRVAEVLGV